MRTRGRVVTIVLVAGGDAAGLPAVIASALRLSALLRLHGPAVTEESGVRTVSEALERLRCSEASGWELVEETQSLAARRFRCSRRSPWDSPGPAFRRGQGYCLRCTCRLPIWVP